MSAHKQKRRVGYPGVFITPGTYFITGTKFVFKSHLVFVSFYAKHYFPIVRRKDKKNHCFNVWHLRKISIAERRGSSRFFNNKVVSHFDLGQFLKKSIYGAIFEQIV